MDKNITEEPDIKNENLDEYYDENVNSEELKKEVNTTKIKNNKKKIIAIVLSISVIILSIITFFVFNKLNTTKTYNNVYLSDINVSSKNENELKESIKILKDNLKNKQIHLLNKDNEIGVITAEDIDLDIDLNATIAKLINFGRDKGIILNNFNIFKAIFTKKTIEPEYIYSETNLSIYIDEITKNLDGAVIDDSYAVDETNHVLIITKGARGNSINEEKFTDEILALFKANKESKAMYRIVIEEENPETLDIDVVYSKVARKAIDATIDESGDKPIFKNHVVGLDFNKENLKEILTKEENNIEGKIIKYNLTITQPKIKLADIKWDLYKDTVSSYKTYFTTYDTNRVTNLKICLRILDGTVVMPGETFSFNNTIGPGTSAQGFLPASTFKNGQIVKEIGGGICQIASTLYNVALYGSFEIKERKNHSLPVGYVPASRDATVYYPYLDFKFKNTRNYPIKIVTTFNAGGSLSISFMGTKEEVEYEVILTSWKTGTVPITTIYQDDPSIEIGKTKVIQKGVNGYTSVGYKEVKLNGKQISKTLLSTDKYFSTQTIIARGTKKVAPNGENDGPVPEAPIPHPPIDSPTSDTTETSP